MTAHISKSIALIERALSECDSWYIAFSGGKDSTVMLDLVRRIDSDIPAVAYVQKWRLPETTEYLRLVENLDIVCSRDTKDKEYFDERWQGESDARKEWSDCTWLATDAIACDMGYGRAESGCFVGLRAEESKRREWQIKKNNRLFQKNTGKWQCYPLGDWTVYQIWNYIFSRSLAYNRAYDILEKIGVSMENQRIAEFEIDSVMGFGSLAILKQGWPILFNQYKERHPEVTQYV